MFVVWNNENAMGSTPVRSTWFTWSAVIDVTASSQSECIARIRRRNESSTATDMRRP
jgi:hypothetical protein